jgi:hypothetical protein
LRKVYEEYVELKEKKRKQGDGKITYGGASKSVLISPIQATCFVYLIFPYLKVLSGFLGVLS